MTLPSQLRELASLIDALEESSVDVEVQDARLDGVSVDGEMLRATLTVSKPLDTQSADDPYPDDFLQTLIEWRESMGLDMPPIGEVRDDD